MKAKETEIRKMRRWVVGHRIWQNVEWKDRKRIIRRKLGEFKKEEITTQEYIEENTGIGNGARKTKKNMKAKKKKNYRRSKQKQKYGVTKEDRRKNN